MRGKLLNIFGYVGITLILAMVAAAGFLVFRNGFKNISNTTEFISAFAGAFFAFVFVKLGELGTRLYARERANQESLVGIEQAVQEYVNRLYGNDFVADDIIKTIDATTAKSEEAVKVNFNFLKPLPINTSQMLHLRNIDFKNDLFNLYADLEKVNGSMQSIQRFYDRMTDNLMSGQLDKTTYIQNLPIIKEKMAELKKFLSTSIEDCVDVATKDRLLLKETSILLVSAIRLKPQNYTDKFKTKIPAERKVVKKEMEQNTQVSSEKIKKTLSR